MTPSCVCRGRGLYVISPEVAGYHRAPSLDRYERAPGKSGEPISKRDDVTLRPRERVSTAYVNDRGDVYHFAADDPGGFGRRCELHAPLFAVNVNGVGA